MAGEWRWRFSSGAYGKTSGTRGRRWTTSGILSSSANWSLQSQVTSLDLAIPFNVCSYQNVLLEGDLLEGEDIDDSDPIHPIETHTPTSELLFWKRNTTRFNPCRSGCLVEKFWWADFSFAPHEVTGGNQGAKQLTFDGDLRGIFTIGSHPRLSESTGNDGKYTVTAISYNGGGDESTVTFVETIPDATLDGVVAEAEYPWFLGTIKTSDWSAQAGEGELLTLKCLDLLDTYGAALPVGALTTSPAALAPLVIRSPLYTFNDLSLVYSPAITYAVQRGRAFYGAPHSGDGVNAYYEEYDALGTATISDFGTPDTETGNWGDTYDVSDKWTLDLLVSDPVLPIPQFNFFIRTSSDELVFVKRYTDDGVNQCFYGLYYGELGTVAGSTNLGDSFKVLVPKGVARRYMQVRINVPLSTGNTSRVLPIGGKGAKAGVSFQWGGFILGDKVDSWEPIKADFSVWDRDGTPEASSDLDGDGKITAADWFLALYTGPEAFGAPGIPAASIEIPATFRRLFADYLAYSTALNAGENVVNAWNSFATETSLEQVTGVSYDARLNRLRLFLQAYDDTADDFLEFPEVEVVGGSDSNQDTYAKVYGTSTDKTPFNGVTINNFLLNTTSGTSQVWISIPNPSTDGLDALSDLFEFLNLPAPVSRIADGGTMLNNSELTRQQYPVAAYTGNAEVRERIFRFLVDGRSDTFVFITPAEDVSASFPRVWATVVSPGDKNSPTNARGSSQEINFAQMKVALGARENGTRIELQGTNDPNFDPDDPHGAGIDVNSLTDLVWEPLGVNLTVDWPNDQATLFAEVSGVPDIMRTARAVRVLVHKAGHREAHFDTYGLSELFIEWSTPLQSLVQVTGEDDDAHRGNPAFFVSPDYAETTYWFRQRVGTIGLQGLTQEGLDALTLDALLAGARRKNTDRLKTPFVAGEGDLMRYLPPRPGASRQWVDPFDAQTYTGIIASATLTVTGSLSAEQFGSEEFSHELFDPDAVVG